jgi:hypothetical protein
MLTLDLIKKGCEYAEGFEWISKSVWFNNDPDDDFGKLAIILTPDREELLLDMDIRIRREVYYPLFLQKVRRGINKDCMDFSIDVEDEFLRLKDTYGDVIQDFYDNDQDLEKAIIYVLNNMGEKQ